MATGSPSPLGRARMVSLQLSALHLKVMTAQLSLASEAFTTVGTNLNSHYPFQPPVLVTSVSPSLLLIQSSYYRSSTKRPSLKSLLASSPVCSPPDSTHRIRNQEPEPNG